MGRAPRIDIGNIVYHTLNRANDRLAIFRKPSDYQAFENILQEAKQKHPMRILAYCLMPNHWHLVLHPSSDGQLAPFMRWVTLTHTQRWHAHYNNVGHGHLYQGRYKSFPVQEDEHFLQLVRYVERNAKRAGLVKEAQAWLWSSLYLRQHGSSKQKKMLSPWPVKAEPDYLVWINALQPKEEIETIRFHIQRGRPLGESIWMQKTADQLGLQSSFRNPGRPWSKST